jgi:hypothetical protein
MKGNTTTAVKLARFNLTMSFVWIVLTVPSLLFWKNSILWVIVISLWANIVGHFSAYIAARSEAAQQKGHNLTEQDRAWVIDIITSRLHATTITTNIVRPQPDN